MTLSKHLPDLSVNTPQHVSIKLENINSDQSGTIRDVRRIFFDNFNLDGKKSGFGVVGLHPCGDLAATLLRLYTSQCGARFICIVGCCYMKLTVEYVHKICIHNIMLIVVLNNTMHLGIQRMFQKGIHSVNICRHLQNTNYPIQR